MQKKHQEFQEEMESQFPNLWSENPVWKSFDIGSGWQGLVRRTIAAIRQINPEIRLMQVKEKFGRLRIYVEAPAPKEIYEILNAAEKESGRICDQCGNPGELVRLLGYVCTRCPVYGKLR